MTAKLLALFVAATIFGGVIADNAFAAPAKKPTKKAYTVTDRQVELRRKIEVAFKQNELTQKESNKLLGELVDIADDIEKAKAKNAGKLSYKDEGKMEKRLNKVSLSLTKYQLNKRVTVH
jgi:hypothetical protein